LTGREKCGRRVALRPPPFPMSTLPSISRASFPPRVPGLPTSRSSGSPAAPGDDRGADRHGGMGALRARAGAGEVRTRIPRGAPNGTPSRTNTARSLHLRHPRLVADRPPDRGPARGVATALFLTELAPLRLRQPIVMAIEMLAAVPSVIFGLWGIFVLIPWLRDHLFVWLKHYPGLPAPFPGPDLRRQHAGGGHHRRDHDPADHHLDLARDPALGAEPPARGRLRARRHPLGGPEDRGPQLRAPGPLRRGGPRPRPGPRRDDGGHDGDRQPARRSAPRSSRRATRWRA
jgi:hypothetical protein